jgi:HEAT repeat protein
MAFAFEISLGLTPGAVLVEAIIASAIAVLLLLGFILLRRTYRAHYFARRDRRLIELRREWEDLMSGAIPYSTWRTNSFDRLIVETIALDDLEAAAPQESSRLLKFLRASGLIEKQIFDARHHQGWRRHKALVALGRTRAPEGIPALSEGLRDRNLETRLASLRGLGRMACPEAAEQILEWVGEIGIAVPALPLQNALILCCAERPALLLPYLRYAASPVREVLGRVLGEVATPSIAPELLHLSDDELPELRAAAARALSSSQPNTAIHILGELAQDPVWFVRLRALVSVGKVSHPDAVPILLQGLSDSNRLVRLRAAEALMEMKTQMVGVFEKVVALHDRYGLHAYVTALENAGLQTKLEGQIEDTHGLTPPQKTDLLDALHTGIIREPLAKQALAAAGGD